MRIYPILLITLFIFSGCTMTKPSYIGQEAPKSAAVLEAPFIHDTEKVSVNGTGFFISDEGHIATNFQVATAGTKIRVVHNDIKYKAKIVGIDPQNDVAILKIDAKSKALPIFVKEKMKKGDNVSTLGFPIVSLSGRESKATFGNINALSGLRGDIRFYQIDVPIQPGNSGGPLFNNKGEVIGITSGALSQQDTFRQVGTINQNINYALKIVYLLPLMRYENLELPLSQKTKEFSKVELIEAVENSVVLVMIEQ